VSALFWFIGLLPDLATLREPRQESDRKNYLRIPGDGLARLGGALVPARNGFICFSLGWLRPLVLSVHTIVSFDFAYGIIPGWHATIFPPYFRGRCHLCGIRNGVDSFDSRAQSIHLEDFITMRHLDNMGKVLLAPD